MHFVITQRGGSPFFCKLTQLASSFIVPLMFCFQVLRSTSPTSHRVPPHSELLMPATQCRVCGRFLNRAHARKEHEILRHRLTFVDGETFSPTPYVIPLTPAPETSSSQSPATPPTTLAGGNTPTPTTSGAPRILFSGGPSPNQRSNSVSPSLMSVGSVSVSPTPMTQSLPGSMSPVSIPSDISSQGPALFLTPTNIRPSRRLSSRAASSSPMTRTQHGLLLPARAASVSPNQQHSPGETRCRYCLLTLANRYNHNRHILHCPFKFDPSVDNIREYCVLTRPPMFEQTAAILQQLTLGDKINMCRLNRWSIPNIWPLVFPNNIRPIPPILSVMTASRESAHILRGLLRTEPEVSLPKKVLLVDGEQNIQSVLPIHFLTPGTAFVTRATAEEIIVSPGKY